MGETVQIARAPTPPNRSMLKPTFVRHMAPQPDHRSRSYHLRALRLRYERKARRLRPQRVPKPPSGPRGVCTGEHVRKRATAKRRRRTCGRADMPDTRLPPPHVRPCTAHETIRAPPPLLPPLHAPSDSFGAPQRARGGATGAAAAPRARRPRWRRRRRMAAVIAATTAATVVVAAAAAAAATTTAAATAVALAEIVAVVVAAVAAPWALIK